jgi:predicted GIY-YIG superfamily endonuclease
MRPCSVIGLSDGPSRFRCVSTCAVDACACRRHSSGATMFDVDSVSGPVCYLLRSCNPSYPKRLYIGFTRNLAVRLRQHNSRRGGCAQTRGKGPWTLLITVAGFIDAHSAKKVTPQHAWHRTRRRCVHHGPVDCFRRRRSWRPLCLHVLICAQYEWMWQEKGESRLEWWSQRDRVPSAAGWSRKVCLAKVLAEHSLFSRQSITVTASP